MEGYTAPDYADYSDVPVYAASDAVATYEAAAGDDPALAALASNIPGVPGEDYPIYAEVMCRENISLFYKNISLFCENISIFNVNISGARDRFRL